MGLVTFIIVVVVILILALFATEKLVAALAPPNPKLILPLEALEIVVAILVIAQHAGLF